MVVSRFVEFMGFTALALMFLLPPFVSAQTPYFPLSIYPENPLNGDLVEVSISNVNDLAAGARFVWYYNGTEVRNVSKAFTDTLLSDSYIVQSGEWTVIVYVYDRTEARQLINTSTISFTVQMSLTPGSTATPTATPSPTPTPTPQPTPSPTPTATPTAGGAGGGGGGGSGFGGGGGAGGGGGVAAPQSTPESTPSPTPTPIPSLTTPEPTPTAPVTATSPNVTEKKPENKVAPNVKGAEKGAPTKKPAVSEESANETGIQNTTSEKPFKTPLGVEAAILGLVIAFILRRWA